MATKAETLPAVGERIWFRLPLYGEWIPATVVTHTNVNTGLTLEPEGERGLHLEIELDPKRHHSAGTRGTRLNVQEGLDPSHWQRERPATADADYEQAKTNEAETVRYRRAVMTERGFDANA